MSILAVHVLAVNRRLPLYRLSKSVFCTANSNKSLKACYSLTLHIASYSRSSCFSRFCHRTGAGSDRGRDCDRSLALLGPRKRGAPAYGFLRRLRTFISLQNTSPKTPPLDHTAQRRPWDQKHLEIDTVVTRSVVLDAPKACCAS